MLCQVRHTVDDKHPAVHHIPKLSELWCYGVCVYVYVNTHVGSCRISIINSSSSIRPVAKVHFGQRGRFHHPGCDANPGELLASSLLFRDSVFRIAGRSDPYLPLICVS